MSDDPNFTDVQNVPQPERPGSTASGSSEGEGFDLPPPTTLQHVRMGITSLRFAKYLEQFDHDAAETQRTVASLPVEAIDEANQAQMLAAGIEKEDEELQHKNDLEHIRQLKVRRMTELDTHRLERTAENESKLKDLQVKASLTHELIDTYFRYTHRELDVHLTARRAEVMQSIGEVRKFDRGDYDPDKPDWASFEQQVEFRVVSVRGLKNKVPKGEYVMLVSKWEKLGGDPMRWSTRQANSKPPPPCPIHSDTKNMRLRYACEVCRGWCGCTMPAVHKGGPRDFEIKFDSRIFTFFPSQYNVKPYMALVFELVLLPRKRSGQPTVVGWGALPSVDSHFAVINGKFRFPMLRGPMKPNFNHHESIQKWVADDIENWLCNAYIDVFPHPREHFGRGEFQLQSEFTNTLLSLQKYPASKEGEGWPSDEKRRGASLDGIDASKFAVLSDGVPLAIIGMDEEMFPYARPLEIDQYPTPAKTYWGIIRTAVMDKALMNKRQAQQRQREAVKRAEEQKKFRFSIHPHGAIHLESVWRTQVEYCVRAITDELSLKNPLSTRFWLNILAFIATLYVEVYVHSMFIYMALTFFGTPVLSVHPEWYGLIVEYSVLNTTALMEFFVVFYAEVAMYFVLFVMIALGWGVRKASGFVPEQLSKFVFTTAFATFCVPFVELIVDGIRGTRHSDVLRLEDFFTIHKYGPSFAYLIFAVVYFFVFSATFVTTFLYTMRLHLNGILQDAYWRILIVNEDNCFVPEDLELSIQELQHILSSSERWRGKNGERRKTIVSNITTTDDEDKDYKRIDQHIAVYTLDCGDEELWFQYHPKKIYREFYVTNDGAILEVIDEALPMGMAFVLAALQYAGKKASDHALKPRSKWGDILGAAAGARKESLLAPDQSGGYY